ncbi:MAG: multidrug transporter [Rhodobacteraceae bacterium CG17_big_fil_post_rev_8_21_14_2_50_65_11]|nr:MAG: multidrug transporter [Rhodobacteraceae bacterium CG17_big_fil_post_rev_8_21_14_2_50_65_11]
MSGWIVANAGTPAGAAIATALALLAAILHAVFGALQKGRHSPLLSRGVIDAGYGLMAAPVALFVVPWPETHMWPIFGGVVLIHIGYKTAQIASYQRGAYTVVYPVMRGTGPLFAVIGAWLLFGEVFTPLQWLGVAVLLSGIYGLAIYNLRTIAVDRQTMVPALWLAVLTGLFVAAYTTFDAYGIRASTDPFTFLAWFFFLDGMTMPVVAFYAWRRMPDPPAAGPLALRGMIGGLVALASFGSIMLATRLDQVGQVAVLRETSTVFAALIGWLMLGERVGPRRLALMGLIAAGAVVVQVGG